MFFFYLFYDLTLKIQLAFLYVFNIVKQEVIKKNKKQEALNEPIPLS